MNPILKHFTDIEFAIIGHRGAAGLAPENTLLSFDLALQWRCPMVELDVYATSNEIGQIDLMVFHDDQLNRTTNGRGPIAKYSTEYLRTLDAGGGQQIPYLDEVTDLLSRHLRSTGTTVALNIELKGPKTAEPVATALSRIKSLPVLVSSFNHAELQRFRDLDALTPIAPLYGRYQTNWSTTAADLTATAVNLGTRVAHPKRVTAMREAGYQVFVYTVNSIDEAMRFRDMGVSGIFSDRPDILMRILGEENEK